MLIPRFYGPSLATLATLLPLLAPCLSAQLIIRAAMRPPTKWSPSTNRAAYASTTVRT